MDSNCGRFTIVFSGEIYNYKLKKELVSKECFFSNLILKLSLRVISYGARNSSRLEIFSFCIYDKQICSSVQEIIL